MIFARISNLFSKRIEVVLRGFGVKEEVQRLNEEEKECQESWILTAT